MNTIIASRVKAVRPDQPQAKGLCIVPILGPSHERPEYRLLEGEALNLVRVTEISEAGSVPELKVTNGLDMCVFLMDGQELIGAKQNRILNTDVMVPAGSSITIPVSCVEARRWHPVSPQFAPGKSASHRIRAAKQARVHEALKAEGRHDAGQGAVWDEVACSLSAAGAVSFTAALHDAYVQQKGELDRFRAELRMPEDAVGVAVFQRDRFQGLDLFDRHSTLRYFWESLIDSYAIDFLAAAVDPREPAETPQAETVKHLLQVAADDDWEEFRSPGVGVDWRLANRRLSGSALVVDDVVIHLQLFARHAETSRRPRIHRPYPH